MNQINIETCGKWILAGEHSVLRGSPALVFPLKSKKLVFNYGQKSELGRPRFSGERGSEYEVLFGAVFEKCCVILKINSQDILSKQIEVSSSLPVGTGLGASAAFCVAMTLFFQELGYVKKEDIYSFALNLENLFHGESSGVDIAVCLSQKGVLFERQIRRDHFVPQWKPVLCISYTGQRGMTFDCVQKVKAKIAQNPRWGERVDAQMKSAVQLCVDSLSSSSGESKENLALLARGLTLAAECFHEWDLDGGAVNSEMERLLQSGALAVKPTGSGGGGYVLSLWSEIPENVSGLAFCFD